LNSDKAEIFKRKRKALEVYQNEKNNELKFKSEVIILGLVYIIIFAATLLFTIFIFENTSNLLLAHNISYNDISLCFLSFNTLRELAISRHSLVLYQPIKSLSEKLYNSSIYDYKTIKVSIIL